MNDLTSEEQDLLNSFEQGEWISHPNFTKRVEQLQLYAQQTSQVMQILEINLPTEEIAILEQIAQKVGVSSHQLITSVLHQFIENSQHK